MKSDMPFGRTNYLLFLAGCALLAVGFICAAQGPHDGFVSLTLSPLLLMLAYLVVLPASILVRSKGD
ncbi:MAG: DUF3098 domain-containing protein [bacterium]|jgi:hypothetical protein|nr:DUF3098 domain-containing protein [bacterium]